MGSWSSPFPSQQSSSTHLAGVKSGDAKSCTNYCYSDHVSCSSQTPEELIPGSWQQHLAIHLHWWLPSKLTPGQVSVVGGADEVVGQRLVHLLVELQPIQEHRCILIRHQVSAKAIAGHLTWMEQKEFELLLSLLSGLFYPFWVGVCWSLSWLCGWGGWYLRMSPLWPGYLAQGHHGIDLGVLLAQLPGHPLSFACTESWTTPCLPAQSATHWATELPPPHQCYTLLNG